MTASMIRSLRSGPVFAAVLLAAAAGVLACGSPAAAQEQPPAVHPAQAAAQRGLLGWELTPTGTDTQFRGLDAVSRRVAWLSGSAGTVLRTVDGGASWQNVSPPGAAELEFRDVEAFDAEHATVLAIGEGDDSRIYRTADGGATWSLVFTNDEPRAFYDCLAFGDRRHGLALSDPVDGRFRILATDDGGAHWQVLPGDGMPAALTGEFAFAASGTCLVASGRHAWFASGGATESRVFRSDDGGRTWQVASTAVRSGPTAGIYSLAFRDARHGVAVGGDFQTPDQAPDGAARSADGGTTWPLAERQPGEYRSGSAWLLPFLPVALAVGPTGTDVTVDGGRRWFKVDDGSFDSVDCARDGACWASGAHGRAARLRIG
jgi:photosystem II stability/assembly factor-like uncharacterized protein